MYKRGGGLEGWLCVWIVIVVVGVGRVSSKVKRGMGMITVN